MGLFKYGAQCCNNCRHWQCHAQRKIRGNPPAEIYTDSNCDKCSLTNRSTLSKDSCNGFSHLYGASVTFPLVETNDTEDCLSSMIAGMDEPSRAFTQAIIDFTRSDTAEAERLSRQHAVHAPQTCRNCNGTGRVRCTSCSGTGKKSCAHCDGEGGFRIKLEVRENYERFTKDSYWLPDPDLDLKFYGYEGTGWGSDGVDDFDQHDVICDKQVEIGYDEDPKVHVKDALQIEADDFDYPDDMSERMREKITEKFNTVCERVDKEADDWGGGGWSPEHRIKEASVTVKRTPCVVRVRFKDAMGFPYEALVNLANKKVHLYDVKPEDAAPVMVELERRAEAGDVELQNDIGQMYAHYPKFNHVVEKDYEKAAQWFLKAAKAGLADAMDNIGNCYKDGKGVEEDKELAALWYSKAAKKGLPWGQYHYAKCFLNGTGVEEDNDMALHWYMKAARQGLAVAQKMVGRCAEEGWGMTEDPEIAFYWMGKAANNGDEVAMHNLSVFYGRGYGCDEDESMKDEWADKAKENGYVEPSSSGW